MSLLSGLRRFFSGKRNVIQTRAGAAGLPGAAARSHWIVGRALCMYRREDFSGVPRSKRRAALELKLPVWSPFERTGHHCVWSGGSAMVWFLGRGRDRPRRGACAAAPRPPRPPSRPRPGPHPPRDGVLPAEAGRSAPPGLPGGPRAPALAGGACSRTPSGFSSPPTSTRSAGSSTARRARPPPPRRRARRSSRTPGSPPTPWRVSRTAGEWFENQRADSGCGRTPRPRAHRGLAGGEVLEGPPPRGGGGRRVHSPPGRARPPSSRRGTSFVRQRRTNLALKGPPPPRAHPGPPHGPRGPGPSRARRPSSANGTTSSASSASS